MGNKVGRQGWVSITEVLASSVEVRLNPVVGKQGVAKVFEQDVKCK